MKRAKVMMNVSTCGFLLMFATLVGLPLIVEYLSIMHAIGATCFSLILMLAGVFAGGD